MPPSTKPRNAVSSEILYKNPWHSPLRSYDYGPEFYRATVRPTDYRGFSIYHRMTDIFDVVKHGTCITQCAGINGAYKAIDQMLAGAYFFHPGWLQEIALQPSPDRHGARPA